MNSLAFCVLLLVGSSGVGADFGDKTDIRDTRHLKQHLEHQIDVDARLWDDEEENRFHYFSLNDLNKDAFVDGIEILKAISHGHHEDNTNGAGKADEVADKIWTDDELEEAVDRVLKDTDLNNDGKIDYSEYSRKVEL